MQKKKQLFLAPVLLLMMLLVSYRFFFPSSSYIEHASSYLIYPFLVMQHHVLRPVKTFFERQKSVQELVKLLEQTRQERDLALAKNIMLQSSAFFAAQTKEITEFRERYEVGAAHIAHIVLRQCSDQSHFIFIDRGSSKGIVPNMVAVYKNCLIGRVAQVYPYYSKVVLISDKSCKIAAQCSNTQSCGIHEGVNKKEYCRLNYVSHLCPLQEDDLVISSGEGLVFPQGFGLGKIKSFERKGLFYDVLVEPLVDIKTIEYCYIVQK